MLKSIHPLFALAAMLGCCWLIGCNQSTDGQFVDNGAPRSKDFDPVKVKPFKLFEDKESEDLPELYSADDSKSARQLPTIDRPVTESRSQPASRPLQVKPVAKRRTEKPKPSKAARPRRQPKPPAQLAIFRKGDSNRQHQLLALESAGPPAFALRNWMNSRPLGLQQLRGKIVLLDFWATWCNPCLNAIAHNNSIANKYKKDGVVVIGICHQQGSERMKFIAQRYSIRYPIAADVTGRTIASYQVSEYPSYYLIDRKGRLRLADCRSDSVETAIKALLAEEQ